jgi:hypothetical protein
MSLGMTKETGPEFQSFCIGFCSENRGWSPRSWVQGTDSTAFPLVRSENMDGWHCHVFSLMWNLRFCLVMHPPNALWHFSEVVMCSIIHKHIRILDWLFNILKNNDTFPESKEKLGVQHLHPSSVTPLLNQHLWRYHVKASVGWVSTFGHTHQQGIKKNPIVKPDRPVPVSFLQQT